MKAPGPPIFSHILGRTALFFMVGKLDLVLISRALPILRELMTVPFADFATSSAVISFTATIVHAAH
jgi:hypothetical protein